MQSIREARQRTGPGQQGDRCSQQKHSRIVPSAHAQLMRSPVRSVAAIGTRTLINAREVRWHQASREKAAGEGSEDAPRTSTTLNENTIPQFDPPPSQQFRQSFSNHIARWREISRLRTSLRCVRLRGLSLFAGVAVKARRRFGRWPSACASGPAEGGLAFRWRVFLIVAHLQHALEPPPSVLPYVTHLASADFRHFPFSSLRFRRPAGRLWSQGD
jgi:hypothetical protein